VAAGGASSPHAAVALLVLCERYWYPLYAFVRRRGYGSADAQNLTQAIFTMVLEKHSFSVADSARGRFRSFLLPALSNLLMSHRREGCTQMRGGNQPLLSSNFQNAENRYTSEPSHCLTSERIYDRQWALTLLESVIGKLSYEYANAGKIVVFDRIKCRLSGDSHSITIREIAEGLQMTEGAVICAWNSSRE
jgi:DNA-directed RNA polymerase specialized sigma24 family protein